MGTPLSFVVLSWVNAWASQAFSSSRHHGDDGVGRSPVGADAFSDESAFQLTDYDCAVSAIGGSLNRPKTFRSSTSWTMCEVLGVRTRENESGMAVFVAPPCPAPGLKAPVLAESRCGNRYLKRQERVMKTLFPWLVKDPRLHLPAEIGGLGYLGRGLAVSRGLRARLGALVSRDPTFEQASGLNCKAPFREGGLYPRPLVRAYRPQEYWQATKLVQQEMSTIRDPDGERVTVAQLAIYGSMLTEQELRFIQDGKKVRRRRDGGRPERTRTTTVFRSLKLLPARRLSRWGGIGSLRKWAAKAKALTVTVVEDVASEIRDRIPDTTQGRQDPVW